MSITISKLKLEANTADGPYGLEIPFHKGLFILRVENSHGKSTCINSIAYALGMEMSLGQQTSRPPFPPSLLKSIQDENGVEKLVISSFVMLEIENDRGEVVTLKRNILGADAGNLITIYNTSIDSIKGEGSNLFLHKEGDTTRDLGFYNWLAEFFGWDIPFVPNNSGKETPLYPALLFPLFFIEQKKGWSSIQATTPFHFQISQAKKRAFEFILKLDVNDIVRQKAKNKKLIDEVQQNWKLLFVKLQNTSIRIGGKVNGVKETVESKFDPYKLDIFIEHSGEWKTLTRALDSLRKELYQHTLTKQPTAPQIVNESQRIRVRELRSLLIQKEERYEALSEELSFIHNQVDAVHIRINNLHDDKRKYEDLKKVKSFKVLNNLPVLNNECPTCGREYSDHSIELECSDELMSLEESLDFIKSQISTFKSVLNSYVNQLDIKSLELCKLEKEIDRYLKDLSRLKTTIDTEVSIFDEEYLREKIRLENLTKDYEDSLVAVGGYRNDFHIMHVKYKELIRLRKNYPEHGFSTDDFKKLNALEKEVVKNLIDFGFSSFDPSLLKISKDSYLPTREGFDLGFDTSASDGIRVIWSYLISLFTLSEKFSSNHPRVLIFDEPRQQEANKFSFSGLLRGASRAAGNGQIIFATSEEKEVLDEALEGCQYKLLSFCPSEGKILRKLPDSNVF